MASITCASEASVVVLNFKLFLGAAAEITIDYSEFRIQKKANVKKNKLNLGKGDDAPAQGI